MANSRVGAITSNDGSPEAAPRPRDNMSVKAGSLRVAGWIGGGWVGWGFGVGLPIKGTG